MSLKSVTPKVLIIDYGSGNLRSAAKAFERMQSETGLNGTVTVSGDSGLVSSATHIVLPGVGAYADCRRGLAEAAGMEAALTEAVQVQGKPFLGICVGMQLLADVGREHEDTQGLGWIGGAVEAIEPSDKGLKIPHMGWNDLAISNISHPLLEGLNSGDHAYFVHSYQFNCSDQDHILAEVDYGGPVTAMIGRDNIAGTQFHPEKSQQTGLRFIENFIKWRP